jgi:flagellar biosynthesis protein FlhG
MNGLEFAMLSHSSTGASSRCPGTGRLLAIASGKGGVGKTWLAITLAHVLAKSSQSVLLFDADLGLANIDIQLGLMPKNDLGSVISGRLTLDGAVARYDSGGFDILPGRSGSGSLGALDARVIERLMVDLRKAADHYDIIILDLGAGIDRAVRQISVAATDLLVVTTAEPTSLTDAYAVVKLYAADGGCGRVGVVVNQASTVGAGRRTYETLARACESFLRITPDLLGVIRHDRHVSDAIRRQSSLVTRYPSCSAVADVEDVALRLSSFGARQRLIEDEPCRTFTS